MQKILFAEYLKNSDGNAFANTLSEYYDLNIQALQNEIKREKSTETDDIFLL